MIETISAEPAAAKPRADADGRAGLVARIANDIRRVRGQQRCAVARRLHRSGISMAHLQVLWILGEHGPLPVGRLADFLGIALPNATGLVGRMEQRGLVSRGRVSADRRVVLVSVTDAGRETADEVDGWGTAMLEQLFEPLDEDDLRRFAAGLERVGETLAATLAHEGAPTPRYRAIEESPTP